MKSCTELVCSDNQPWIVIATNDLDFFSLFYLHICLFAILSTFTIKSKKKIANFSFVDFLLKWKLPFHVQCNNWRFLLKKVKKVKGYCEGKKWSKKIMAKSTIGSNFLKCILQQNHFCSKVRKKKKIFSMGNKCKMVLLQCCKRQ